MNYEHLKTCPGCFKGELWNGICPRCSYNVNDKKNLLALKEHTILAGKYAIGKVLGVGGFGITYLALDLSLNKLVAIKEYLPRDIAGREAGNNTIKAHTQKDDDLYKYGLEKFIEEARTLARFDHYNIVRVREVFQENSTCYIVMDYYEGVTLEEYIVNKGGRLTEQEALNIMMPILDGLKVVHSEGILHRDIKPQNIYITKEGRSILIDFGSAKMSMGQRSRSMSVVLTPGYAPYEQYQSKGEQGVWTDIYSVGATMYYMLTGELPPDAVERKVKDELIPPKIKNPSISENTNRAIMKALSIHHWDRQKSVQELQDMFLGAERQTGIGNQPQEIREYEVKTQRIQKEKSDNKKNLIIVLIFFAIVAYLAIVIPKYFGQKKGVKVEEYIKAGDKLIEEKQYDAAIEEFNKAIQLDPNYAKAYYSRGVSYAKKELHNLAIADYTKAIQLDPNYAKAYYSRGISYYKKELYDMAIADYTKAIQLDPNYAQAYFGRGTSYAKKELYDMAIADYTKAIQLDPNYAKAYYNRGISYAKKELHNLAIADYTKAIQLDPNNALAYYIRGVSYAKKELHNLAIADYTKAIQLDPNNALAYLGRGTSYGMKGLHDLAIADYTKACYMGNTFACDGLKELEAYLNRYRKFRY